MLPKTAAPFGVPWHPAGTIWEVVEWLDGDLFSPFVYS